MSRAEIRANYFPDAPNILWGGYVYPSYFIAVVPGNGLCRYREIKPI